VFISLSDPGAYRLTIIAGIVCAVIAGTKFISAWWRRFTTEIAVTDRRIVYKRGFIRRDTFEMKVGKIESVHVDQSIFGRMLDYGEVTVCGTGSSFETLSMISAPLKLRKSVMTSLEGGVENPVETSVEPVVKSVEPAVKFVGPLTDIQLERAIALMRGPFFFLLVLICFFLLIANEASRYSNQSSSQPDNGSKTPEASPNPQEPSNVLSEQASPAPIKKITPDTSTRPGTLAAPPTQPSTAQSPKLPYFKIKDECYTGLEPIVSDSSSLREDIEPCTKSEEYLTHAWSHIPDDRKSYCTENAQLRDIHGVQYFVIGLCVKEQIDDETLRSKMPPPSDVEEILRIHQIVIRYTHDHGETPRRRDAAGIRSMMLREGSMRSPYWAGLVPDNGR
jgi:hypothetical protein